MTNVTKLRVQTQQHIHRLMEVASACRAVGVGAAGETEGRAPI